MGNIAETVRDADLVVAGWGNNAWDPRRVDQVRSLLPGPLHALGVTKGGNPGHPPVPEGGFPAREVGRRGECFGW